MSENKPPAPAPAPSERCAHRECMVLSNSAHDWPCLYPAPPPSATGRTLASIDALETKWGAPAKVVCDELRALSRQIDVLGAKGEAAEARADAAEAEVYKLRAHVETSTVRALKAEVERLRGVADALIKDQVSGTEECVALQARVAELTLERYEANELLAEAGGWASFDGFYRLSNRINVFLGGTEWGKEKIWLPGSEDEPWVSESDAKVAFLSSLIEESPHAKDCDSLVYYGANEATHGLCDCWKAKAEVRK